MKRGFLAFAIAMAVVSGCGGGGGGSTSVSSYSDVRAVSVLASDGQTALNSLQFQPGDLLTIKAYGTDVKSGGTVLVPISHYSISCPASVATIDDAGNVTVVGVSGTTYTITGTYSGGSTRLTFKVIPATTRVTGLVRTLDGTPISGAGINLCNGTSVVASGTTGSNGRFLISVSGTVNDFVVDTTPLSGAYFSEFAYGTETYSVTTSCYAPISGLTALTTNALPHDVVLSARAAGSPPPPPPTGCIGS